MLARMSIRAKISIVVTFLLLSMSGLGLLAITKMRSINANTVDIQTSWLPSVRLLGELRAGVITYRNVIRQHMLAETLEEKLANEKTLETVVASNTRIRANYEKLITSPEERAIYEEWGRMWDTYKQGTLQVMELSRKAAGKMPQEANALNTKTVNPIGLKADELLTKDIELNTKGSNAAGAEAEASYNTAFMLVLTILGVSAVAGIAVSIYLVRDVSAGIASIVKPMQALGAGDLSAHVPHQGMKTEMGTMGDALQVFKQALIDKRTADQAAAADAEAKIERGRRVDQITRDFDHDRRSGRDRVVGLHRARSLGRHADRDCRTFAGTDHLGRCGVRTGLDQCAVGGFCDRRNGLVDQRDQPPGAGICQHRRSGRASGSHHQ